MGERKKDTPLVLIHGYPFDHTMWFSTIAALGSHARVLAPDLPGFGKNPVPVGEEQSMEFYAQAVARALLEHKYEKVVVAGMSMGGYVALAFAEKYPDRLCGLGLISTQATADSPETKKVRAETIDKIRVQGVSASTDALLPKMFSEAKANRPEIRQVPLESAQAAGIDGLCWAMEAMARRPDRTKLVKSLRCPVLIVHGTDDKIVPVANARTLAESCARPIYMELRGVGHASPLEAPDQVAGALARLMTECKENGA